MTSLSITAYSDIGIARSFLFDIGTNERRYNEGLLLREGIDIELSALFFYNKSLN